MSAEIGFAVRFERMKSGFFDQPAVERVFSRQEFYVYGRFGAFVRTTAKHGIRSSKKQKTIAELTDRELQTYKTQQRLYKQGKRRVKPRRPLAPSKPGKPPYSRTGLLRDFIFFSRDESSRSVVIGPAKVNAKGENAPENLEYGTSTMAARPYMQPAFDKELSNLPQMWAAAAQKFG